MTDRPLDLTVYLRTFPVWAKAWRWHVQNAADQAMAASLAGPGLEESLLAASFPWPEEIMCSYRTAAVTFTEAVCAEVGRRKAACAGPTVS